jgi:hypothetical protein
MKFAVRHEPSATGDGGSITTNGRWYARPDPADYQLATIVDTTTGKTVLKHRPERQKQGWHIEDVFLYGDYVVYVDADTDSPFDASPWMRAYRYHLPDGADSACGGFDRAAAVEALA